MKYGFLYAHSLQIFFKNREFLSWSKQKRM
jgi:hypothetical protein